MEIKIKYIRLLGLAGVFGGLILFAGDMLLYYNSSCTNLKLNMGKVSDIRIIISGIFALFSTWFYLLGLIQVYYALKKTDIIVRNTIIVSFAGILTSYGIIHAAYTAIATSSKLAIINNLDMDKTTLLASTVNNSMRLFIYPLFIILSILFIHRVWTNKTAYSRWIILFFPLIPFLLKPFFLNLFSGKLWVIFAGGFLNLILVLFFTASTIILWSGGKNK